MISVAVCVVLYNPGENVINNILKYNELFNEVVVLDNSDKESDNINRIKTLKNIVYLSMNGNRGIARAQNEGLKYLYKKGYDYALTLDQDSYPIGLNMEYVTDIIQKNINDYSIITLNRQDKLNQYKGDLVDVDYWISSGNFINLSDFKKLGGFNNKLFIDYVDYEYDWKVYKSGKKIGLIPSIYINHKIGNTVCKKVFSHSIVSMNHAPIRYYYRYRNSYYLYKKDNNFFKKLFYEEMNKNIIRMLLVEKNRFEKICMIIKGLIDSDRI